MAASVTLIATPSDLDANAYLTLVEVAALFPTFDLKAMDRFESLEEADQCSLIFQGTRKIDEYQQWGARKVDAQPLAFPRANDKELEIPREVQAALMYYIEFKVLKDLEPIKKLQAEGVTSSSIAGQSISMSGNNLDKDDASGLPAGCRQQLRRLHRSVPPIVTNRNISGSSDSKAFFG